MIAMCIVKRLLRFSGHLWMNLYYFLFIAKQIRSVIQ